MMGTVHCLEVVQRSRRSVISLSKPRFLQLHRREHRLGVIGKVTAFFVKTFPRDVRGANAFINGGEPRFLCELFQFFGDDRAAREKQWQTWTDNIIENEKIQEN